MDIPSLLGKYLISMDIHCLSGLHIGGSDEGIEIEGMDNPVIKDPMTGHPYIPGSSLKGRLRRELEFLPFHPDGDSCVVAKWKQLKKEREEEAKKQKKAITSKELEALRERVGPCQEQKCDIVRLFGAPAAGLTRLIFRDARPDGTQVSAWESTLGKGFYTELKTENAISRLTAVANPRTLERVPAGSKFPVKFIMDVYEGDDPKKFIKILLEGLGALEDGALGGSGSRGSGQVCFKSFRLVWRPVAYYLRQEGEKIVIPEADFISSLQKSIETTDWPLQAGAGSHGDA